MIAERTPKAIPTIWPIKLSSDTGVTVVTVVEDNRGSTEMEENSANEYSSSPSCSINKTLFPLVLNRHLYYELTFSYEPANSIAFYYTKACMSDKATCTTHVYWKIIYSHKNYTFIAVNTSTTDRIACPLLSRTYNLNVTPSFPCWIVLETIITSWERTVPIVIVCTLYMWVTKIMSKVKIHALHLIIFSILH